MPSKSKSQQRLFGMVHASQQGKLDTSDMPDDLVDRINDMSSSVSKKVAKEFAKTKTKNKPDHVSETMTFKQFLNMSVKDE